MWEHGAASGVPNFLSEANFEPVAPLPYRL